MKDGAMSTASPEQTEVSTGLLYSALFNNSSILFAMKEKLDCNRMKKMAVDSEIYIHLHYIIESGENLRTELNCPFCKRNKVEYFIFPNRLSSKLTCCGDPDCMGKLLTIPDAKRLLPIKLSTIAWYKDIESQRRIEEFFRKEIFHLPENMAPEEVSNFLLRNYKPKPA